MVVEDELEVAVGVVLVGAIAGPVASVAERVVEAEDWEQGDSKERV